MSEQTIAAQLEALDTAIFTVPSQTGEGDRKSLLTLQRLVRTHIARYVYLEIGSHLGGTLVPHLHDEACRLIYSIDKRPASQLDERGVYFDYPENSTRRMMDALARVVPEAALLKLITFDSDVSDLGDDQIPCKADLALIDGEHTNSAVFRDFVSTLCFLQPSCVVAFHDANLVFDGLLNIEQFLAYQRIPFRAHFLPDSVYAIGLGEFAHTADQPLSRIAHDRAGFLEHSRITLWQSVASHVGLIRDGKVGHRAGA